MIKSNPATYKLKDQKGEEIKGTFYFDELQKVEEPEAYRIEKIKRKRKDREGKLWYFVKWVGYDSTFNSFVREEDIKRIR